MSDRIDIEIILKSNTINQSICNEWILSLLLFKPERMSCKKLTKGKFRKADISRLQDEMKNELDNDRSSIMIKDSRNSISLHKGAISSDITSLSGSLEREIFDNNKADIIELINNFMKNDGVVAYMSSLEDLFWQNNEQIDMYRMRGKSLEGVKTKKSDLFPEEDEVDIEFKPGHSHRPNGIWFGSCWMMWYGKEYFKYISKEKLSGFKNCYENKLIDDKCLRITLYETPWEYDNPENREKQWDFRRSVGVDEMAHALEMSKCRSDNSDPSIEINQGSFKHGGVRLINYYYDSDKNLVEKSKACEMRTVELDENGEFLWSEVEKYNSKD